MKTVRLLTCALLLAAPSALPAQFVEFGGVLEQSDLLYMAGDAEAAFEMLHQHLASDSLDYEALWRAARAGVVTGLEKEGARTQNIWLDPAVEYSHRAVRLREDAIDAYYWRGVSAGKRAMNAGPRRAVELAQIVYDDAHRILVLDSLHAGGHNLLGKLNYEIMSLSRVQRTVAKLFMGNRALDDTSWENAEHHLRRAVELWPEMVLFQFDLALLHDKRGRREEAIAAFERVLEMPTLQPVDRLRREEARERLAALIAEH